MRPHQLPAWQAAQQLARRELSAETLMRDCLDRIAERDGDVRAFVHLDPDAVLAQARALDAGPWRGALHGLPLGVKDLFDTADMPTGYGSPLYAGHRPAADAAAVALCREAGALLPGKTVSTEFAYFHPGLTRNPRDLGHTPGGSSSGSAAAVADAMLPLALATQTAASIIRPAAYCGIVGYKPTLGSTSAAGAKSLSATLDTVGAVGRCVRDVALLGGVLTGDRRLLELSRGTGDGTSDGSGSSSSSFPAPRIGLCATPEWPAADEDVQAAWAQAQAALAPQAAALKVAAWPQQLPDLVALQKRVMAFEMARALSHERVQHPDALSPKLRTLFEEGMAIDGAQHQADLCATAAARTTADDWFRDFDVLLAPSTTGEAPAGIGATGDPLFCRGWTLLGLPCVHLPFAKGRNGLPVGLQLVGRAGDDHRLLAAAQWCEGRLQA
jgi:Asp-tRNA(Asn)/Glu-tRNA(Gln) amidotransferase A subunit family amidase